MRRSRRTIASVLSNPRKRRKAPKSIRRNRKRRKSRRSRRRMGALTVRKNPGRSRKGRRRNPARLSSRRKKGWKRIRRNRGKSPVAPVARMARKLPVVGAPLGAAITALPAGIAAGATVELPMRMSPWVASQTWVPDFFKTNEWAYFTTVGALTGGVLAAGLRMSGLSRSLPKWLGISHIALLATTAASGAGYAKMRSRQIANAAGIPTPEQQASGSDDAVAGMGQLVVNGSSMGALTADLGMGPAYAVSPGGYGYGALVAAGV